MLTFGKSGRTRSSPLVEILFSRRRRFRHWSESIFSDGDGRIRLDFPKAKPDDSKLALYHSLEVNCRSIARLIVGFDKEEKKVLHVSTPDYPRHRKERTKCEGTPFSK